MHPSKNLLDAREADRRGDILRAAGHYEAAWAGGDRSLDVLLDLAILYWQATDPGVAAGLHLDAAFMSTASNRSRELLDEAVTLHPASTEARFWSKYIAWIDLGESFDFKECERLLLEDPAELIPALHGFASPERRMEKEALELLRQRRDGATERSRYVVSVLESAVRSLRGR